MNNKTLDFEFEFKLLPDEEPGTFEGYASVFGETDHVSDIVQKGAFKKTLAAAKKKKRPPALLWQHDTRQPIGAWDTMEEDDKGLYGKGRLLIDDIPVARQAHALMKNNGLSGLSIGYRTIRSKVDETAQIRTLVEVELFEVSLVTFPALDSARVNGVKAGEGSDMTIREFEAFLRDEGGFSIAAAKAIAVGGYKSGSGLRDEGELAGLSEMRDMLLHNAETLRNL
jgi:HK97 family phage prohead protease